MPLNLLLLAGSIVLAQPPKPSFVVECRVVELQKVAHRDAKKSDSTGTVTGHIVVNRITSVASSIKVSDGRSAMISNEWQRPFVTGFKSTPNGKEPTITVLKEGLKIDCTVTSIDAKYVRLDATIRDSHVADVELRRADEDGALAQAPSIETVETRVVGPVRLGEKREMSCGRDSDRSVELVICRSGAIAQQIRLPAWSLLESHWRVEQTDREPNDETRLKPK
jgi:hypothetical protein